MTSPQARSIDIAGGNDVPSVSSDGSSSVGFEAAVASPEDKIKKFSQNRCLCRKDQFVS